MSVEIDRAFKRCKQNNYITAKDAAIAISDDFNEPLEDFKEYPV
ncbi:MAG: DUF2281 domain-containing protein [Fibromonadales bacterium]|nr:DUF2281 domain-containing protein [Fibromonadales bacterium]